MQQQKSLLYCYRFFSYRARVTQPQLFIIVMSLVVYLDYDFLNELSWASYSKNDNAWPTKYANSNSFENYGL